MKKVFRYTLQVSSFKFQVTILSALFFLSFSSFAHIIPLSGNGSSVNPWQISTAEELFELAHYVNTGNGNSTAGVYYKLMNNINLGDFASNKGWTPIGRYTDYEDYSKVFQGVFDGNGYVVQNLAINRPEEDGIGLFGYIYKATIQNLGIENCNITGQDEVGGLVGYSISSSTISNCYTTGKITGKITVGGLVGFNFLHSQISGCQSTCNINGEEVIGGLVGGNMYATVSNSFSNSIINGNNIISGCLIGKATGCKN
jgi:hypothetical protein